MKNATGLTPMEMLNVQAADLVDSTWAILQEVSTRYYNDEATGTEYQNAKDARRAALEAQKAIRKMTR